MRFIETRIFTRAIRRLLLDDEYRALQLALVFRPEQGPVIRGSGGLRRVRWGAGGHGKRGGVLIIYYWDKARGTFYMLFAYSKSEQEDLNPEQLQLLSRLVREEFK